MTSGTIASRCSLTTAIDGSRPWAPNASSMSRRVEVPAGVVISGRPARRSIPSAADDAFGQSPPVELGGSTAAKSWRPSSVAVRSTIRGPTSVMPISLAPVWTISRSDPVSGSSRRTRTPGADRRNRPTNSATGSTDRVGRQTRSSRPPWRVTTPATADRAASAARTACRAGSDDRLTGRGRHDGATDAVEELHPQLVLETSNGLRQRRLRDAERLGSRGEPCPRR